MIWWMWHAGLRIGARTTSDSRCTIAPRIRQGSSVMQMVSSAARSSDCAAWVIAIISRGRSGSSSNRVGCGAADRPAVDRDDDRPDQDFVLVERSRSLVGIAMCGLERVPRISQAVERGQGTPKPPRLGGCSLLNYPR